MSRDYLAIAESIEADYPRASGGPADEPLRLQLVDWANDALNEIQRIRRWSLAYGKATQVTTPGTAVYSIPAGIRPLTNIYWLDSSGYPTLLENYAAMQGRLRLGEGAASTTGYPAYYAMEGTSIQIFPVPDANGPTSGNYTLVFEGYQQLTALPIVETTGTVSNSATLTVPSTAYLTARGVLTIGTGVSIRGAGYPQSATINDDWVTNWSAFPLATTVTLTAVAPGTVTVAQTFFNSQNWLISNYPKVLAFAMLREVSTRLKDDYQKWEARYQHELDLMIDDDMDYQHTLESFVTYTDSARIPQLRFLNNLLGYEVRGGIL